MIPAGTRDQVSSATRHDRDGGEVAEVTPERVVGEFGPLHRYLHMTANSTPPSSIWMGTPAQARFDECGCGQVGHIQNAPGTRYPFERVGHGGIGQLHDEAHVWSKFPYPEGGFQGVDLVALGAYDSPGQFEPSLGKTLAEVCVAADVGDTPVLESAAKAMIGVIIDHDHGGTAEMELLDCSEAHSLETTHNHVVSHTPDQPGGSTGVCCQAHLTGRLPDY